MNGQSLRGLARLLPVFFLLGIPKLSFSATLIYSNDVLGEIEPCGCRNNPMGGMARKANFLKRHSEKGPEVIQVDAGDLLFSSDSLPELLQKQAETQATFLLKAMDLNQHDVVVPGEKDFALGVKTFDELRKKTKIKFLAANLQKKSGKKFLEPSAIFHKRNTQGKTIRVGIFGIVGDQLRWPKELKATSAIASARNQVKALRKKVDILIAVTHQGFESDQKLAKEVSGIDIIVGAHSQSFIQTPIKIGKTAIYQSSFRNQYIGVVTLGAAEAELPSRNLFIGLDAEYESQASASNSVDILVKEFKAAIAEINSKETVAQAQATHPQKASTLQTFPKCAECHLKQFDFWRKTPHANSLQPLFAKEQARNKECLSCHTVGLGVPGGFTHVNQIAEYIKPGPDRDSFPMNLEDLNAYLQKMHKAKSIQTQVKLHESDPEAEPLHQSLSRLTRSWAPVQCENCHIPGGEHPFSGSYTKTVEKTACLKCHTQAQAPKWYTEAGQPNWDAITAKRALITCPPGSLDILDEEK